MDQRFEDHLVALVAELTDDQISQLIDGLERGFISINSTPLDIRRLAPELEPTALPSFLSEWRQIPDASAPSLAFAIRSVHRALRTANGSDTLLEAIWTGPSSMPSNLRHTSQVIPELIERASSYVVLVGYSINIDYRGYGLTGRVFQHLVECSARGVHISAIIQDEESNFRALSDHWPSEYPAPELFTWTNGPTEDHMTKLHAKVLIADDTELIVTSANLTYHGLDQNLELGIHVRGFHPMIRRVRAQFDELRRAGIIHPIG